MKHTVLYTIATAFALLSFPNVNFGQAPDLRTASAFAVFTKAGAFGNAGATNITGDIGTDAGDITGFPPGTVSGQTQEENAASLQAGLDVDSIYNELFAIPCNTALVPGLGNNQVLTPDVYCLAAGSLTGNLTLDAQGDPNALFILQVSGAFSTAASSSVSLINSAVWSNVYWVATGAFDLGDNSVFNGTIVSNGAITLLLNAVLNGRALTRAGAISLNTNTISMAIPPLPVTLLSFNAEKSNTKTAVNLDWVTASELNSAYFLIERSADGINFTTIGTRYAAGYSNSLVAYAFTDDQPAQGVNYYRLNQFDLNGIHEYSTEKAVSFSDVLTVHIYPNPFVSSVNIVVNNASPGTAELSICTILGDEVMRMVLTDQVTGIELSSLPPGVYFYKVISNSETLQSGRLISQH